VLIGNRRDCTGVRRYDSSGQQYIDNWATAKTQATTGGSAWPWMTVRPTTSASGSN